MTATRTSTTGTTGSGARTGLEDIDTAQDAVAGARAGIADTMAAIRSGADGVGDRLPEMVESVRAGAVESARTFQAWPESTQRLAAAFSAGLGLGLTIGRAPRLVVLAALLPAIATAATAVSRDLRRDDAPAS